MKPTTVEVTLSLSPLLSSPLHPAPSFALSLSPSLCVLSSPLHPTLISLSPTIKQMSSLGNQNTLRRRPQKPEHAAVSELPNFAVSDRAVAHDAVHLVDLRKIECSPVAPNGRTERKGDQSTRRAGKCA